MTYFDFGCFYTFYEHSKFHAKLGVMFQCHIPCGSGEDVKVFTQLTKNVSGTFGFGCMKVWLNLTLLERNAYVRRFSYKCLVKPNVLKTLFKYSDSV